MALSRGQKLEEKKKEGRVEELLDEVRRMGVWFCASVGPYGSNL